MKERPLTEAMIEGLLLLRQGGRFGIDRRTENALYNRGLARWERWTSQSGMKWTSLALTRKGREVANSLHIAALAKAGAIPVRHGFAVIDGGKSMVPGRVSMPWRWPGGDAA